MKASYPRNFSLSVLLLLILTACTPSSPATQAPEPTLPPTAVNTATVAPTDTVADFTPTAPTASPTLLPSDTAAPAQAPSPTQLPESPVSLDGGQLVEERCSVCHGLSKVRQPRTESEWRNIVDRMIGKGANLSDQEKEAVLQYLITTYAK